MSTGLVHTDIFCRKWMAECGHETMERSIYIKRNRDAGPIISVHWSHLPSLSSEDFQTMTSRTLQLVTRCSFPSKLICREQISRRLSVLIRTLWIFCTNKWHWPPRAASFITTRAGRDTGETQGRVASRLLLVSTCKSVRSEMHFHYLHKIRKYCWQIVS